MSTEPQSRFRQVVFSGGGIRCFWHGGWMDVVTTAVPIAPERVSGVSGGAMSAAAWIAGVEDRLFDRMHAAFARQDRNVSLDDLNADDGLTPHQRIYGQVVDDVLDDAAQARIAEGPAFQVLLAKTESRGPDLAKALLAGAAYQLEKLMRSRPDSEWAETVGLSGLRVDARAAARNRTLPELIKAAATIPPVFRIPDWQGEPVMDGGLINQTPLPEPDEGKTLVLMTREYRNAPKEDARVTYVSPSRPVASNKIDFTDPSALREAWALGKVDGQAWLDQHSDNETIH